MIRSSPSGVRRTRDCPKNRRSRPGVAVYLYRHYDPVTGRWPSRDPIEERGDVNLYGFVRNEPVRDIDVLGLSSFSAEAEKEAKKICKNKGGGWEYSETRITQDHQWTEWEMVGTNPLRAAIIISIFFSTHEDVVEGVTDSVLSVIFWEREGSQEFEAVCICKITGEESKTPGTYTTTQRKRTVGYIVYSNGGGGA